MKKQISIILLSCLFINSLAQSSFQLTIQNEEDQIPTSLIEDVNGNIICSIFDQPDAHLIKINNDGAIIDSLKIESPFNGDCNISEFIKSNNDYFVAFGEYNTDNEYFLWNLKLDFDLNILENHLFTVPDKIMGNYLNCIKNSMGNYVVAASYGQEINNRDIFIYEIDTNGLIINENYWGGNSPGVKLIFDIAEQAKGKLFLTCNSGNLEKNEWCDLYELDSNLNIINLHVINNISLYNDIKFIEDSIYLLSGLIHYGTLDSQIKLLKIKSPNSVLDSIEFGKLGNDTVDYPGFHNNISYILEQNIYYGGTSNLDLFNPFFSNTPSWLILAKLTDSFNVYWQNFYGGDACYNLLTILATQDGGCVMAGTRYDYQTQNQERDVYILKVNEDGILTWTNNFPETTRQVIVYPNPGQYEIMIKSISPNLIFELFDIQGVKMLSKKIATEDRIDTKDLPQGMYIYQVLNPQAEIIETGKWIKN